ncbi:MAG: hypothetical protein AB1746_08645 [Candidatus Zixiibacteriota bacterium]
MRKEDDKIELMLNYLSGNLAAGKRRETERLISTNRGLVGLFSVVKGLFLEGQRANWNQLQDATLKLANRLFIDYQKSEKSPKINHGITVFDSLVLPLPEGVRPAAIDKRRLKYKVGDMDLDISLYPISSSSYEMIGQVFDLEADERLTVRLRSGKREYREVADQFNLFRFMRIPVAKYVMDLLAGRNRIGTVELEL